MSKDKADKTAADKQTSQNQTEQSEQTATPAASDDTPVTCKSTKLNIEFTHRKDWTMKESTDGKEIILTSPRTSYTKTDGKTTTGVFTLKMREGVTDAMEATIEKAIAARNSEVIGYIAPTDEQRHYTNVSYAGQKDVFNFFIITGNTEFKVDNPFAYALTLNSGTFLIVGGYGADKSNNLNFDLVPAAETDSGVKEQAIDIVESLKIY